MPRRNKVPESVSTETPRAKALEKRRRDAIADAERRARTPAIGPRTEIDKLAQAEADEALRLSTGFGEKHWMAIPKEEWGRLDQMEKERLAKIAQDAKETGVAYAMPGTMIAGTRGIRNLEAAFRLGKWAPPAGYPVPNLDLADKMLHDLGGRWSALTRDQKLAIRTRSGLQMRNGGGGAWEYMPAGNIRSKTLTAESGTYGDVFDFSATPEYEIAFPGITKTPVNFEKMGEPGVLGYHDANGVGLSDEYAGPMRSFQRSTTGVHEFLHEVQRRAKQPPGANSTTYVTRPLLYKQMELDRLIETPAWKDIIGAIVHPLDHLRMSRIRGAVERNLDEGLRVGGSAGPMTRDAYQNAGGEIGSRLGAFVNELNMSPRLKAEFLLDDFSELHRRPLDYRLPEEYKAGLDNGVIPTRQDAKGGNTRTDAKGGRSVRAVEGAGETWDALKQRFRDTGEVISDLYDMSGLKKRVGEAGEVADALIANQERAVARIADKGLPVLSQLADAVVSPALVGARAAVANVASDGGKAYTPEVRDASHFSQKQLRAVARAAAGRKNGSGGRVEPGFDAGEFGASQAIGGFSVKGDAVTDVFDVNSHYDGVPDAMSRFVGGIFGSDKDPDAGKVKTRIPLSALHQAAKGGDSVRAVEGAGDTGGTPETGVPETPDSGQPAPQGGPRIVINPTTFHNKKDALCVAFNEAFRVWMEANGFEPESEPTDAQRKFLSDTAYADDELQLRRTILARIATFDTSVKDPTDDQLSETASFLDAILESDWCKNDWERDAVSRLSNAVKAAVGAEPIEPREAPLEAKEQEPLQARAAMGGGETDDEERIAPPPATGEDLNGDGTAIDHQADVIAQAEAENESDREEANADYAKLQASGALADNASFDNEAPETAQKPAQEPSAAQPGEDTGRAAAAQPAPGESPNPAQSASGEPMSPAKPRRRGAIENDIVSPDSPGSLSYKGTRKGGIENDIVSPDSPGSLSFRGMRRGGIENPIVNPDSPGSLSFRGMRRGGIENPIVNPESEGSIAFSGIRSGGIENPIVDPDSPGSLSYRRRKKRRR